MGKGRLVRKERKGPRKDGGVSMKGRENIKKRKGYQAREKGILRKERSAPRKKGGVSRKDEGRLLRIERRVARKEGRKEGTFCCPPQAAPMMTGET